MKVLLKDLAKIDRVKKDKVYKAGTVYVGVSATRGDDVHYLKENGLIDSKYAAIEFTCEYDTKYLYYAILANYEEWFSRYVQYVNVVVSDLGSMELDIDTDINSQIEKVRKIELLDIFIDNEERFIGIWQYFKESMLDKMYI